ncbi:MAG: PaaI family thioesterase [Candidatus Eremiobacteraeota bacterium]|nr:PaaI family thioesterase [Candidatus Eremiobacteraeota bacterium]
MSLSNAPVDDGNCFACGADNPIGMHLHFERTGEQSVRAFVTLEPQFQGWKNIAHGGIAMALLDEGMAHAAAAVGFRGVTASMSTRFRAPVPLETPLEVDGEVIWIRRHVLALRAFVRADGKVLVEGDGHFVAKGRLDDVQDRRNPKA